MTTETTLVHVDEPHDVYIGRGPGKRDMHDTPVGERGWLGNPHTTESVRECPHCDENHSDAEAVRLFEHDFLERIEADEEFRNAVENLKGKMLACHCKESPCHGDKILKWLGDNRPLRNY